MTPITEEMKPLVIAALRDQCIATPAAARKILNDIDSIEGLVARFSHFQWPHTPQPANDRPEFQRVEPTLTSLEKTFINEKVNKYFREVNPEAGQSLVGYTDLILKLDKIKEELFLITRLLCCEEVKTKLTRQEAINLANALMSAAQDMKE